MIARVYDGQGFVKGTSGTWEFILRKEDSTHIRIDWSLDWIDVYIENSFIASITSQSVYVKGSYTYSEEYSISEKQYKLRIADLFEISYTRGKYPTNELDWILYVYSIDGDLWLVVSTKDKSKEDE